MTVLEIVLLTYFGLNQVISIILTLSRKGKFESVVILFYMIINPIYLLAMLINLIAKDVTRKKLLKRDKNKEKEDE